jgi:hypothetical protein
MGLAIAKEYSGIGRKLNTDVHIEFELLRAQLIAHFLGFAWAHPLKWVLITDADRSPKRTQFYIITSIPCVRTGHYPLDQLCTRAQVAHQACIYVRVLPLQQTIFCTHFLLVHQHIQLPS